ncbi:integrase [Dendronalium sp. ChiSLP03b]|uniref:integrase n=1 Tax=Dendronalium sp. ChiSLP03b TaxID=3075381 RepID=UPI00391AB405
MRYSLEEINKRLKASKRGVSLRQRGDMLSIRATLPPRPNSKKIQAHQQDVALGMYANPAGLKAAEDKAIELAADIVKWKTGQAFPWENWIEGKLVPVGNTCEYWIEAFKQEFLIKQQQFSASTWERHYSLQFDRLPAKAELTGELLLKTLLSLPINTWTRHHTASSYIKLAKFAGIDIDLRPYKGKYNSTDTIKDLPTDEAIASLRDKIPSRQWQWVYGMLAAYGLRPHEVFFVNVEPSPPYKCRVSEGKTGARIVQPFYPEWAERWKLWEQQKLATKKSEYWELGRQVRQSLYWYLKKVGAYAAPYDLRHAYAIRISVVFELPVTTSAKLMGHSIAEHLRTYQRHIDEKTNSRAVERAIARFDGEAP